MTRKAYAFQGISGWTIGFWDGAETVRYLHGYPSVQEAIAAIDIHWNQPPRYQNGFPTAVSLRGQRL